MGWINWNVDMTLLQYQGKWYKTYDDLRQGSSVMQYFDIVIEVTDNNFNVIKNRYTGETGADTISVAMRMKLFVAGKTFDNLPTFTKLPRFEPGGAVIGYQDNGDLFEYALPTRTM